jgi:hypothetical protein
MANVAGFIKERGSCGQKETHATHVLLKAFAGL